MKPISDARRRRILVELHRAIDGSAAAAVDHITAESAPQLDYPPNGDLSADESAALRTLEIGPVAKRAIAKLVADAAASSVFHLFSIIDAVADPADGGDEVWLGAQLAEPDGEDHPMMHDAFLETYWDYRRSIELNDPGDRQGGA